MSISVSVAINRNGKIEMPSRSGVINLAEKRYLGLLAAPQSKDLPQGARRMIDPNSPSKRCTHCKEDKPLEEFYPHKTTRDGRASWCKKCIGESWKGYPRLPEDPAVRYDQHLRRTYGITLDQYNWMHEVQGGVCAICGQSEKTLCDNKGDKIRRLAVDHDHNSSQVRGLLCMSCNRGLGYFQHNPDLLKAAVRYLEKTTQGRRKRTS